MTKMYYISELQAVQKNAHLVDLENAENEYLVLTCKDRRRYSRERARSTDINYQRCLSSS